MKIALLGYGKMGKEIEKIALTRGHEIILKKSSETTFEGLENADVAIDFSLPSTAVENISTCFNFKIPVVSGTTGWLEHYNEMVSMCELKDGAFLYASNFSVGVNIFFELNNHLAKLMSKLNNYNVSMEEIHHTQKLDAPSGTAISLANGIIKNSRYNNWTLENPNETDILIEAKRIENVPGTHHVFYRSEVDEIEIKHEAFSRQGFALGAVIAAEWIANKKGIYSMKDVLNLG
ncbi:4-hydroxy-tetrahydrodipicolinate reductase [Paenimyroides tangerinum]|uniref:4-hydroxy-tetrahydrodipicolinate reductase n=1 Tax=Paenimyroides tangerinum TaxID=2488728 RepID=A0A3P3W6N5_9FLAO|nr:4-hydroxy-tetrahydrodipicolinate reductase [Paenimyroides tangerinum]RRJ90650.1 4-hydroxy-tetrahydrodipicolinate reductase [Paenimyroides tangerinum]